jgi:polar amino acid transport system substrate-binding protein
VAIDGNEFSDDAKVLEIVPTGEQYGIAINKENTKLVEDINKALADMEADGTLDKLKKEYIG